MKISFIAFLLLSIISTTSSGQKVISGRMNLKSYHELVRKFKVDSTYDKASFYPRKELIYRLDDGSSQNTIPEKRASYLVVKSGTKGHLVSFAESSQKDRLGTTVTYSISIDFGEETVVKYIAQSFYSASRHVKNWTNKNFLPMEALTIHGNTYLLVGDMKKMRLDYTYSN